MIVLLLLTCIPSAFARPFRPGMMPNGGRFNCSNCHVSSNGGGARNLFGADVLDIVGGSSAIPFWSPTLAALDSDGDGFTNGQELGDPDGDGTPIPGASVSNPGSATSKPNQFPTAAFLRPTTGKTVARPALVTIEASATDSDGTIARVELLLGANIVATVTSAPFVFKLDTAALTPGTLDLGVRAIDNRNGASPIVRLALTLLPEVRIQTTGVTAGRAFEMAWAAPVGTLFVVEASANLTTWTQVGTVAATAEGAKFTEAQPPDAGARFYRVGLPE
jgi:hypothetical protein